MSIILFNIENLWIYLMIVTIYSIANKSIMLKIQFRNLFLSINLAFFPQQFLSLTGIPRWYLDYSEQSVENGYNHSATQLNE